MKLNMGCGNNKLKGYLNVDLSPRCEPDQVVNLESMPWPWPDNSVKEVVFWHCLEHLGGDSKTFLDIFKELYRVCENEALIRIAVPHPRHDNYLGDPTHVRPISPQVLALFSKKNNEDWKKMGVANTPLAFYLEVDFETVSEQLELDEPYRTQVREGRLSDAALQTALREKNNIAVEYRIDLKVRKDPRAIAVTDASTAFLHEPVWSEPEWKGILLNYLKAFTAGEAVALVLPLAENTDLKEAEGWVLEVVLGTGREVFPDVILVDHQDDLLAILRRYGCIQWLPRTGEPQGSFAHRMAAVQNRPASV